jgi:hypothetical protein
VRLGSSYRTIALVAVFLGSARYSWASINACDTSAATASFNGLAQNIANGCAVLDDSLSNLTTSGALTTANLLLLAGGSSGPSIGSAIFDWRSPVWTDTTDGTKTTSTTFNYVAIAHTGDTLGGCSWSGNPPCSPGYVTPNGANIWTFRSITLDLGGGEARITDLGTKPGNFISIRVGFCLSDSSLNITGVCSQGATSGAQYGFLQVTANQNGTFGYSCQGLASMAGNCTSGPFTNPSSGIVSFLLPSAFSNSSAISVFTTVTLNRENYGGTVSLHDFQLTFGNDLEAPEPATFALFSVSLLAIATLRRKSKR